MTNTQKTIAAAVLAAFLFQPAAHAAVYREEFTTGKDWLERMTLRQKFMSLIGPAAFLHQHQVPIGRALENFVPLMDHVLEENPYVENEDIANLFASTVFAYEPQSRPALLRLDADTARRIDYANEGRQPRTLDPEPREPEAVN